MRTALLVSISFLVSAGCATPSETSEAFVYQDSTPAVQAPDLTQANADFQAGNWQKAAEGFEAALAIDPTQGAAWFRLGYALHALGELERAIPAHEKAMGYPAFAPVAAYNLGCAQALLGNTDASFTALDRAIELGFINVAQVRSDSDLTSLHGDARWKPLLKGLTAPTPTDVLRHMDFWVGDWEVKSASGQLLGTNKISKQENGNLIFEEWTSAGTGNNTGKSINYWDRDEQKWKQVWVSSGGGVLHMAGNFTDGAMRFVGRNMYKGGKTVDHRTTLTPLSDGRVRQYIEESSDGGKTWAVGFDGYYSLRAGG